MPRALTTEEIRNKQKLILTGALNLFETRSFRNFRMEDLAHSLGISKGMVFKYFKSKDILFLKMLEIEYETNFDNLEKAIKEHSEMDKKSFFEFMVS